MATSQCRDFGIYCSPSDNRCIILQELRIFFVSFMFFSTSGIRKIDPSLYESFSDHVFGCDTVRSLQLCSMTLPKHEETGYYHIEHEVSFGQCIKTVLILYPIRIWQSNFFSVILLFHLNFKTNLHRFGHLISGLNKKYKCCQINVPTLEFSEHVLIKHCEHAMTDIMT